MAHRLILLSVLVAGVHVSACASTLSPPPAQVAVVAPPAQPDTRAPAAPKGPPRRTAAGSAVKLHLTYSERLLVPRGSEIGLTVRDANGNQVYTVKTSTKRDAPPY